MPSWTVLNVFISQSEVQSAGELLFLVLVDVALISQLVGNSTCCWLVFSRSLWPTCVCLTHTHILVPSPTCAAIQSHLNITVA